MKAPSRSACAAQTVLWAAGGQVDLPIAPPAEVSTVADRLEEHCLLGRFLAQQPEECGNGLIAEVDARQARLIATARRQCAAVSDISVAAGKGAIAVLKGIATFALTGDLSSLRTGDVDVVARQDRDLPDILSSLGYERTRGAFLHEVGEFTRDGIEIDLHEHFPVLSLPRTPIASPGPAGPLLAGGQPMTSSITGPQLLDSARPAVPRILGGVPVVGAEELVVVLAAHIFMNYVNAWSISHREKVYIRLGELLDIELLTSSAEFDWAHLERLLSESGGHDALGFVAAVGRRLLGRDLVRAAPTLATGLPPRCFWWSIWLDAPPSLSVLLERDWYELAGLIEALGNIDLVPGVRTEVVPGDGRPSRGILVSSQSAPGMGVWVETDPETVIHLQATDIHRGRAVRLRVDGGSWAVEWSSAADQAMGAFAGNSSAKVDSVNGRSTISVRVPDGVARHALVGVAANDPHRDISNATLAAVSW